MMNITRNVFGVSKLHSLMFLSCRTKTTLRRGKFIPDEVIHKKALKTRPTQLYDYFFAVDFEATCEASRRPLTYEQEIIEFPVYKVEAQTFKIEDIFHSFVRPTLNPVLSNFCSKLTGISESDIADQPSLEIVVQSFNKWMTERTLNHKQKFIFVTSGDWDLKKMLPRECQLKNIYVPPYFYPYINVNKSFALTMGKWPRSGKGRLQAMLRLLDLEAVGEFHQGTSDCENIIKVMEALADRGHVFRHVTT